ncbi:MAG: site-specific integrase [Rhodospirillales bacterium]|nr:site-specific integrase [Rhodospirillales bacterium]
MPKRSELTISKQSVDRLSVDEKETVFWDRELPGFGVRVYPSGSKTYVVQSRGPNGIRRVTLGRHGEITAEEARKQAAAAVARIKQGEDPVARPLKRALTVAELAERYMEAHVKVRCNAHTQGIYAGSLRNHILPKFGAMAVASVGREEVAAFHYGLRETPRAANRALMVLSKIFSLAEAWGMAPASGNPCRFVLRYKEGRRERFLTEEEYRRVGLALCELEAEGPAQARAAAALRLIMLTGCRRGEVLTLRWSDVDRKSGEFRLRDAKTGARMVPLTPTASQVLTGITRVRRSPWVFPGKRPDRHLSDLSPYWQRVRERAEVEDVRIHDLRHSFASRALALGLALPMIGRLLGHTDIGSTARYAHLSQDAEKIAVARVGDSIEADIVRAAGAGHAGGHEPSPATPA